MRQAVQHGTAQRFENNGRITAELVGTDQSVTITNIGTDGFGIVSDRVLPAAERQLFWLTTSSRDRSLLFAVHTVSRGLEPHGHGPHAGKFPADYAFRNAGILEVRRRIQDFIAEIVQPAVS